MVSTQLARHSVFPHRQPPCKFLPLCRFEAMVFLSGTQLPLSTNWETTVGMKIKWDSVCSGNRAEINPGRDEGKG